jgi:hypothetical protein
MGCGGKEPTKPGPGKSADGTDWQVLTKDISSWQIDGEATLDKDGVLVVGGGKETRISHTPQFGAYRLQFEYRLAGKDLSATHAAFLRTADMGPGLGLEFPQRDKTGWQAAEVYTVLHPAKDSHELVITFALRPSGTVVGRITAPGVRPKIIFAVDSGVTLSVRNARVAAMGKPN